MSLNTENIRVRCALIFYKATHGWNDPPAAASPVQELLPRAMYALALATLTRAPREPLSSVEKVMSYYPNGLLERQDLEEYRRRIRLYGPIARHIDSFQHLCQSVQHVKQHMLTGAKNRASSLLDALRPER